MLQHMGCWRWAERSPRKRSLPLIVFAPVGTAFTGHVGRAPRAAGRPRRLVAGVGRRRGRPADGPGQADVRGDPRAVDPRQGDQRDGDGPAGHQSPRHPPRHVQPGVRQAAGRRRSQGHGQRPAEARAEDRRAERDRHAQLPAGLRHGQAAAGRPRRPTPCRWTAWAWSGPSWCRRRPAAPGRCSRIRASPPAAKPTCSAPSR